MLVGYSVIRRYTPPTCTLKILAKNFSRWTRHTPLHDLSFELSLDDPRLPKTKQITIKGNYEQLELLCSVVGDYVQNWLNSAHKYADIRQKANSGLEKTAKIDKAPYLQAKSLLKHQLVWDTLVSEKINLSPSQLFDLANALEQYKSEITDSFGARQPKKANISMFKRISVASLLLAVGLTILGLKLGKNSKESALITTAESQDIPQAQADNEIIIVTPPPLNLTKLEPILPPSFRDHVQLSPPNLVNPPQRLKTPPSQSVKSNPVVSESGVIEENKKEKPANTKLLRLPTLDPRLNSKPEKLIATPNTKLSHLEQVRVYFQQRWKPPQELTEKLEYRLIITQEGTLAQIIPIGRASQEYLAIINVPPKNMVFVSPLQASSSLKIRLVLDPNAIVQTFKEDS